MNTKLHLNYSVKPTLVFKKLGIVPKIDTLSDDKITLISLAKSDLVYDPNLGIQVVISPADLSEGLDEVKKYLKGNKLPISNEGASLLTVHVSKDLLYEEGIPTALRSQGFVMESQTWGIQEAR
jgi:hypothetical protein